MLLRSRKRNNGSASQLEEASKKVKIDVNNDSDSESNYEDSGQEDTDEDTDENMEEDMDENMEEDMEQRLRETEPEAYENLKKVKDEINRTEPNIIIILKEPLLLEDRAKVVQLYEIYKSQTPNTDEWLVSRTKVNDVFENAKINYTKYQEFTSSQHSQMKLEMDRFTKNNSNLDFQYKILSLDTSTKNKEVIFRKYKELCQMDTGNEEYVKLKNWIHWATEFPYDKMISFMYSDVTKILQNVRSELDKELYGMENVKQQLLIFLNARLLNPSTKKCNLGLVGPPGVGKTMIARIIAKSLNYPCQKITYSGNSNAEFLKGHDYAWIGAQPGEIVKCLTRMECKNGIILLDEYNRMVNNNNVGTSFLEITDPSQNSDFKDTFLGSDISVDLSPIFWMMTMNELPRDPATADRIFPVYIEGYNYQDKIQIIENYVLPKALKSIDLNETDVVFGKDVSGYLINKVCRDNDKGVRSIEKAISELVDKIYFLYKNQDTKGNLEGFNVDFDTGKKVKFPFKITKNIVNKFIEQPEISDSLQRMIM